MSAAGASTYLASAVYCQRPLLGCAHSEKREGFELNVRASHRVSGHPGIIAVTLLVAPALLALEVARISHLGLATSLVALLIGGGGGGGLSSLYLMLPGVRDLETPSLMSGLLDDEAAQLRAEMHSQSKRELRDLYESCLLPVHWRTADKVLFDIPENVCRAPAGKRCRAVPLAGELVQIAEVYKRIASRRLVVLGRRGAGKTYLATLFVLGMTSEEAAVGPVPVMFRPGPSWNPSRLSLEQWLSEELVASYPHLGRRATADGKRVADLLVSWRRILPVIDGWDEIPSGLRRRALERLNDVPDMGLVFTSCVAEYRDAVRDAGVLKAAAGIELEDLTLRDLEGYLPRITALWQPVLCRMRKSRRPDPAAEALLQVLASPLYASLAGEIFRAGCGRQPAELLNRTRFRSQEDIKEHLMRAFIPSIYRNDSGGHR
jgi:hypothetical protein